MTKLLWVSWEDQRRNRSLAQQLDAELYEFAGTLGRPWPVRYLLNARATIGIYRRRRPRTVICQNPSAVLALLTVLLRRRFGYRVGLDTHNAGFAIDPWAPWYLRRLALWLQRRADFVIAHNDALAALVKDRGGTVIALPDPLPTIQDRPPLALPRPFNLLFICSFNADEPYQAVFEAARSLGPEIGIYVTGTPPTALRADDLPAAVVLCGRLPWERYDQLLRSVNGVIDLTTREHCLLCGAYEAVAAGQPMVLSRTTTLMGYFDRGAVFTDNRAAGTPHAIWPAILELRAREAELRREVASLRTELVRDWNARKATLLALL